MRHPYGIDELNPEVDRHIQLTDSIRCHIRGCNNWVVKPTRAFPNPRGSICHIHGIYIHASTYIYDDPINNLLWHNPQDISLFQTITKNKRDQRFGHEASEDALTWNIFRGFHREQQLNTLIKIFAPNMQMSEEPTIYYWACNEDGILWERFKQASIFFNEKSNHRSEPDIILYQPSNYLIFVEAKFGSSNKSPVTNMKRYGGTEWFNKALNGVPDNLCELMRHWLLGTYLANYLNVPFTLINLVRQSVELDIEDSFWRRYCHQKTSWYFCRRTWEDIYYGIQLSSLNGETIQKLRHYLRNKTLHLKPAFSL